MKLLLEIIYKSNQESLGLDRQSVLIKEKCKHFILTSDRVSKDWSASAYF